MQSLKKQMDFGSKNDTKNLVNFNAKSGESNNLHLIPCFFDTLVLSIVSKVLAKNVHQNDLAFWILETIRPWSIQILHHYSVT